MVYRRPKRPSWYVWPTLPGFGRVGPFSSGQPLTEAGKRRAESMELMLEEFASARPRLIEYLVAGKFDLPTLYTAKMRGAKALQQLLDLSQDPPLAKKIEEYRDVAADGRVKDGLAILESLAPKRARLSYITTPKHITDLCQRAVDEGRQPASVRRSLYRAISDLLNRELKPSRVNAILARVKKPKAKSRRDVDTTPDELLRLLAECDVHFRLVVLAAVLTMVDRQPLLRQRVRDFDEAARTVKVPDTKAESRWRVLELSDAAMSIYRLATAGKRPEDRIFGLTPGQVRARFEAAREAAELPHIRFKDLRHVGADALEQAGAQVKDIQQVLGHSDPRTTLIYLGAKPIRHRGLMDDAARVLGLDQPHIQLEGAKTPRPRKSATTVEERFWAKVEKTDTCWLWTASTDRHGAGVFAADGKVVLAHRYVLALTTGRAIAEIGETRRSCGNTRCVRPDHITETPLKKAE